MTGTGVFIREVGLLHRTSAHEPTVFLLTGSTDCQVIQKFHKNPRMMLQVADEGYPLHNCFLQW